MGVIPDELRRNSGSGTNGMQLYRYIPGLFFIQGESLVESILLVETADKNEILMMGYAACRVSRSFSIWNMFLSLFRVIIQLIPGSRDQQKPVFLMEHCHVKTKSLFRKYEGEGSAG